MAKRSKRKQGARSTPDNYLAVGSLEFARFDGMVIARSNYTDGEFAALQGKLAARFPHVVQEIDELVAQMVELVRVLPPEELLKRAWWLFAGTHLEVEADEPVDREQTMAIRMIGYLQSLIASVPPDPSRRSGVTDGEWESLEQRVSTLFNKLIIEYQVCRTAKSRAEDPSLNMEFEEFRANAERFWCSVRGKRYAVHESQALADLLVPHSGVIEALFGISALELIAEFAKIQRSLTFGVQEIIDALFALRRDMLSPISEGPQGESLSATLALLMSDSLEDEELRARAEVVLGKLLGLDLFDLEKITSLPPGLLDELSWSEGQDTDFFADGEYRGWPLRVWPVFKRPFIKLNGRYYCFDLYSLFDNFYRVMQRVIFRLKPDYKNEWNRIQKEVSERLPFEYLAKLLPGAQAYHTVYYRAHAGEGGTKQWCEVDGLLVFDDHLFVIEVKAGAFTYTSPATDLAAHINSLKALVLSPATQGRRFVDYLESGDEVALFDEEHRPVGTLRRSDFRQVTVCAITLDVFTELAAQAQHLRQIGVNVGERPLWSLSVDDLRVFADVFDNPLVFLHFVEQRMRAAASPLVELTDELDHLGLYLEYNNYAQYAAKVSGNRVNVQLNFVGYGERVDAYFDAKLLDEEVPSQLKQIIPHRMTELLGFLANSNIRKRAELASLLLDTAGETREGIAEGIETQLQSVLASGRSSPFSTHVDVCLTVFCWTLKVPRNEAVALAHARTVMLSCGDTDRVLLEVTYTDAGILHEVHWQRVSLSALSEDELSVLRRKAEELRMARLNRAKRAEGKLGRNALCPCGSGKKYKKCCIR